MRALFFTLLAFVLVTSYSQNQIKLYPEQSQTQISKHIYGHFAEHLGRCIYDGMYAGDSYDIPKRMESGTT